MKSKPFLNLWLALSLAMGVGFLGVQKKVSAAGHQTMLSPKLECNISSFLKNDEGPSKVPVMVYLKDKNITVNVSKEIESDEVLFAVFIDAKKEIVGSSFFEGKSSTSPCNFTMPFDSNSVDIHIYKQKMGEPFFLIKKENFIGHFSCLMTPDAIFYRPQGSVAVTAYDADNNPVSASNVYLSRLTPNYYTLVTSLVTSTRNYAEIILPEDKADLLTDDEKIAVSKVYMLSGQLGENVVRSYSYGNDFYLPDGVDEFTIKYHLVNQDGTETGFYNFYINLKK